MSAEQIATQEAATRYPEGYPPGFVIFHDENPTVYEAIVEHARLLKARRLASCGMRYLFEHERHWGQHPDRFAGYALNNNYSTHYSRLIEERESDLRGFIRVRSTEQERAAADASQTTLEFG